MLYTKHIKTLVTSLLEHLPWLALHAQVASLRRNLLSMFRPNSSRVLHNGTLISS